MVSSRPAQLFTEEEYLALERASNTKHEFVNNQIISMAGARPAHNALVMKIGALFLGLSGGRGCLVLSSDQRVHVPATGLYTYPDVTVACGERRYKPDDPPSLINPTLLVEVTSDSTESFDRGAKFLHYQSIPSLREYVVVSHREHRIDHYRQLESGQWLLTVASGDDKSVQSLALGGAFSVRDVYAGVNLTEGVT